jgi:hypothetical protein
MLENRQRGLWTGKRSDGIPRLAEQIVEAIMHGALKSEAR